MSVRARIARPTAPVLALFWVLLVGAALAQPQGRVVAFPPPILPSTPAPLPPPQLAFPPPSPPWRTPTALPQRAAAQEGPEGGEPSVSERLGRLEEAIKGLQEKDDAKEGDEESEEEAPEEPEEVEAYVPPSEPTFELGGRIHFDHWGFPETSRGVDFFESPMTGVDPADRFAFRRIRMEFQGEIFETMLWRMQLDFNSPGEPEMKDVYIGFDELPNNQQLLIGNQKRPLGLDHLNSSRFNMFLERPLVVEAFNEDARRLGIAMYGYTDDEVYHWRYGLYNLENVRNSGEYLGDSLQLSGNARLASSPWYDESSGGRGYFHWAVAGMVARPDGDVDPLDFNENEARFRTRPEARSSSRWIDTGRIAGAEWYEILALESIVNVGPLQVTGEYQANWTQRDATTPGTGPDLFFHGAYVYVTYFLTGEHIPYDRRSGTIGRVRPFENFFLVERCRGGTGAGWGAWVVGARFSYLDLSDADVLGGVEQNVTFDLNWLWTSHSKLQFNLVYGEIEQHRPVGGFTAGHFLIVGTRFAADF